MKLLRLVLLFATVSGCTREASPSEPAASVDEHASAKSGASLLLPRAEAGGAEPSDGGAAPSALIDAGSASAEASGPWSEFARKDDVPICILPSYTAWDDAQLLQNVKPKISLKAGRELIFATYAPGCASLECVRKVTLQCWVDVAGTALTVNTRFSGEEVVGKTCTKDCEETTASCRTPALHPGTYTLTYGGRQKTIRIPGVVQPTCLPLE